MRSSHLLLALVTAVTCVNAIHVELTVHQPAMPMYHHGQLSVSWNITDGTFDPVLDFVALWWQPFAGSYVQYANVTSNRGSASFDWINARHAFQFRYFRGNDTLATSEEISPVGAYPMGVRIVPVPGQPDQLQFIWTSNRSTGAEMVYYGASPSSINMQAAYMTATTYSYQDIIEKLGLPPIPVRTAPFDNIAFRGLRCTYGTCYNDLSAPSYFVDPGIFHIGTLIGLPSGTTMYYQVGESEGLMTEVRLFSTPVAPSADVNVQILYMADAGVSRDDGVFAGSASHNDCPIGNNYLDGAVHVYDAIARDPLSRTDQAAIINGDISYARGWPWMWEVFHNETEGIFGRLPTIAQYGNHEFDYGASPFQLLNGGDSGGEAGIATGKRFNFASEDEPWYMISMGPVSMIVLSSEHSTTQQAVWLEQFAFPRVQRSVTPWLIVLLHRPIHTSSTWTSPTLSAQYSMLWTPLFEKYGVDLVLTGHEHFYERTCPVSSGQCARGPTRDVWSTYRSVAIASTNESNCAVGSAFSVDSVDLCRQACLNQSNCLGVEYAVPYSSSGSSERATSAARGSMPPWRRASAKFHCQLITKCVSPFPLEFKRDHNVESVARIPGRAPIYIVDGTAGGVFTDTSTPTSPLTIYKDFEHWGYSRINATRQALEWQHYHVDGSIVDRFTLDPVNARRVR